MRWFQLTGPAASLEQSSAASASVRAMLLTASVPTARVLTATELDALLEAGEAELGLDGLDECELEEALRWVRLASERGLRVTLATSAERLGPGALEQLARASARGLEVAVYGSTAPIHDFHTGMPGSFRRTLLGVRAARAAGLEVVVTSILTRSNYRHVAELVRLCSAVGVRKLRVAEAQGLLSGTGPAGAVNEVVPSVVAPRALLLRQLRLGAEVARSVGLTFEVEQTPRLAAHALWAARVVPNVVGVKGLASQADFEPSRERSASSLPASKRVLEVPVGGSALR